MWTFTPDVMQVLSPDWTAIHNRFLLYQTHHKATPSVQTLKKSWSMFHQTVWWMNDLVPSTTPRLTSSLPPTKGATPTPINTKWHLYPSIIKQSREKRQEKKRHEGKQISWNGGSHVGVIRLYSRAGVVGARAVTGHGTDVWCWGVSHWCWAILLPLLNGSDGILPD